MTVGGLAGQRRRVYRSPGTLRAALIVTAAVPVFIVLGFVRDAVIVGLGVACFLTFVAWRLWNWGISADERGIRIGRFLRSDAVRWQDITRFEVRPLGNSPFAAYVVLRDGRSIPCAGISTPVPASQPPRAVQRPVDALNALLGESHRA